MKPRTACRFLLVPAALALLTGCEATRFEQAPLAADASCDRALLGHWQSRDVPGSSERTELRVSADCQLTVTEHGSSGARTTDPVRLHTARLDGMAHAWVDAAWAHAHFVDGGPQLEPGEVYVLQYRFQDGVLEILGPDSALAAKLVRAGRLQGQVEETDFEVFVRIAAGSGRKALQQPGLFIAEDYFFERAEQAPQ